MKALLTQRKGNDFAKNDCPICNMRNIVNSFITINLLRHMINSDIVKKLDLTKQESLTTLC